MNYIISFLVLWRICFQWKLVRLFIHSPDHLKSVYYHRCHAFVALPWVVRPYAIWHDGSGTIPLIQREKNTETHIRDMWNGKPNWYFCLYLFKIITLILCAISNEFNIYSNWNKIVTFRFGKLLNCWFRFFVVELMYVRNIFSFALVSLKTLSWCIASHRTDVWQM